MPKLIDEVRKKIDLPTSKDAENPEDRAWVVMDVSPRKVNDIREATDGMTSAEIGLITITSRIREWNFKDESGNPVPITYDNVARLHMEDYRQLQIEIEEGDRLTAEEKKTSQSASVPLETDPSPPMA